MALTTFVQRLFGNGGSKTQAKDRLLTVLVSDRLGLTTDQMEALRKDILATISRHLPVDSDNIRIEFEHQHNPAEVVINASMRRKSQPSRG